eukprot:5111117-Prymnesium_polylepis.1
MRGGVRLGVTFRSIPVSPHMVAMSKMPVNNWHFVKSDSLASSGLSARFAWESVEARYATLGGGPAPRAEPASQVHLNGRLHGHAQRRVRDVLKVRPLLLCRSPPPLETVRRRRKLPEP